MRKSPRCLYTQVHAEMVDAQRQQAERSAELAELLARAQALEAEGNRSAGELLEGLSAQLVAIQEGAAAEAVQVRGGLVSSRSSTGEGWV